MIKNKQAKMSGLLWIAIIAVGAYLLVPSVRTGVDGFFKGTSSTPAETPKACYIEDTTLTVGPAEEMYNPSTKVTTSYHRVFKNNVDKGLYADGSTLTVNPTDEISIIWAENTSQGSTAPVGYYAAKQSFTVPCRGEVTAGEEKDSDAYKLYATDANNVTVRVFNEDNGNLNSATDNETLAAGDQVTLDVSLLGTYEDAYSPFGPIVLVIEGNDTSIKNFDLSFTGVSCSKTDVPGQHSVASVDNKAWAFSCAKDGRGLRSNERWDGGLSIEVETSVNPTGGDGNSIYMYRYDSDYYMNTDTGVEELGVETNDDSDVGGPNPYTRIYIQ